MRIVGLLALLAGGLAGALLIGHYGLAPVGHALVAVGWTGFAVVIGLHGLITAVMGIAWRVLVGAGAGGWGTFVWGRLVRDAASEVLPLSQLGGYVAGALAVARAGVPLPVASASTIVDVTAELAAQLAYTALGLMLLRAVAPASGFAEPVLAGVALMALLLIAFVVVQRRGAGLPARLVDRLPARWQGHLARMAVIKDALATTHAAPGRLAACAALHLATWIASGLEIWLALRFMGIAPGIPAVLALESLLYGARSVAFLVPNAVGVQEGAYIVLGGLLGLPPEAALALSLLKRGRDVAIGVPVLAAWQLLESRRALRGLAVDRGTVAVAERPRAPGE